MLRRSCLFCGSLPRDFFHSRREEDPTDFRPNNPSPSRPTKYTPCSGTTGRPYPGLSSTILSAAAKKHGYKSPYWLTDTQLRALSPGITLKSTDEPCTVLGGMQVDRDGVEFNTLLTMYNAEQTTNPEAVAIRATTAALGEVKKKRY